MDDVLIVKHSHSFQFILYAVNGVNVSAGAQELLGDSRVHDWQYLYPIAVR